MEENSGFQPRKLLKTKGFLWVFLGLTGLGLLALSLAPDIESDDAYYALTTARLAEGKSLSEPVPILFSPPMYPFISACVSRVSGLSPKESGELTSMVFWIATGLIVYLLLGSFSKGFLPHLGTLAWAAVTIHYGIRNLTESTFGFLILLMFFLSLLMLKRTTGWDVFFWVSLGVVGGLAYLTRPEGIIFTAVAVAGIVLLSDSSRTWVRRLTGSGLSLLCLLVIVISYSFYIHTVTGRWSISGKQASFGNGALLRGADSDFTPTSSFAPDWERGIAAFHLGTIGSREEGQKPVPAQIKPVHIPRIVLANLRSLAWGVYQYLFFISREFFFIGFILIFRYLWRSRRETDLGKRKQLAIELFFLAPLLVYAILLPRLRYMMPFVPFIAIFLTRGVQTISTPRRQRIIGAILAVHFLVLIVLSIPRGVESSPQKRLGQWMRRNIPGIESVKVMARRPGVAYYAGAEWYAIVDLHDTEDLKRFMRRFGYRYLVVTERDLFSFYPQYPELVRPGKAVESGFEMIHQEFENPQKRDIYYRLYDFAGR